MEKAGDASAVKGQYGMCRLSEKLLEQNRGVGMEAKLVRKEENVAAQMKMVTSLAERGTRVRLGVWKEQVLGGCHLPRQT